MTAARVLLLRWAAIAILGSTVLACSGDPNCNPGVSQGQLISGDGKHVAKINLAFCCAPGATELYQVTIRNISESTQKEELLFEMENVPPKLKWIDSKNLLIEIEGVDKITKSEHEMSGVHVHYVMNPKLTKNVIRKNFEELQKFTSQSRPNIQKLTLEQNTKTFNHFTIWAGKNLEHPIPSY